MKYINELILDFKLEVTNELDEVYFLKNDNFLVQFICPHEGTDFKYVLRADFPETFTSWDECDFDQSFYIKQFDLVLKDLDSFIKCRDEEALLEQFNEEF